MSQITCSSRLDWPDQTLADCVACVGPIVNGAHGNVRRHKAIGKLTVLTVCIPRGVMHNIHEVEGGWDAARIVNNRTGAGHRPPKHRDRKSRPALVPVASVAKLASRN